jgi:hypothetical protein
MGGYVTVTGIRSALAGKIPSPLKASLLAATGQPNREYTQSAPFPEVPDGWRIAVPDFVGIGAQKCGTSWWYSLLSQHPSVVTPKNADARLPKELHYFDKFWDPAISRSEVAAYQRYFPRPADHLSGEWTPRYLSDPWTVPLLAQAAPDTKILVLLRDPVDRYHSGLTHSLAHGLPRNSRTAAEAFQRGFYGAQLQIVLNHFPRDQVLVQQYEACRQDPATELARTLAFLGLPPLAEPPNFRATVNGAALPKVAVPTDVRQWLIDAYRPDLQLLHELWPELDLRAWPSFTSQTSQLTSAR